MLPLLALSGFGPPIRGNNMAYVAYRRLDGELGTFDPEDPSTTKWEGPPVPVRLRSEAEILSSNKDALRPIPPRPASRVLFRSDDGSWIQHERRRSMFPSYLPSDPRRGCKYAQLSLDESARWFEREGIALPDALVRDIAARRQGSIAPVAAVPPALPRTDGKPADVPSELPDLVTLAQASALVNRTAAGLRHYRRRGMPKPFVQGIKGKPSEYRLSEMRPWLERTFSRNIPEVAIQKFRSSGK
jgi:hypothetical protein